MEKMLKNTKTKIVVKQYNAQQQSFAVSTLKTPTQNGLIFTSFGIGYCVYNQNDQRIRMRTDSQRHCYYKLLSFALSTISKRYRFRITYSPRQRMRNKYQLRFSPQLQFEIPRVGTNLNRYETLKTNMSYGGEARGERIHRLPSALWT